MRLFSRPLASAALGLCLLAGGATEARAGLADVIWGMSGPQMYGYGFLRCRATIVGRTSQCSLVERRLIKDDKGDYLRETIAGRRTWVSLEGLFYTSGTKDHEEDSYGWFHSNMLSFEPMFEVASKNEGPVRVFHGGGLAGHFLFGDFRRFANAGFKVRPVAVEIGNHWEFAYHERYYPVGFAAYQFGVEGAVPEPRSFERTWGFSITIK